MAGTRSWSARLVEKVADKIVESAVAWVLGIVVASGAIVGVQRLWSVHAPTVLAAALAASPWIVTGVATAAFALVVIRARALTRRFVDQTRSIQEAEDRGRRTLELELRDQWTDDVAVNMLGLQACDAWCFVYENESTPSVHMTVRAWSAIPYPAALTLVEVTFAIEDGRTELASVNPHLAWSPLRLGLNDELRLAAALTPHAAETIRAATKSGCATVTAFVRSSLSLDGGPPTNPDKQRSRLVHPLRVQQ